jgi:glycosyltransferase involved in cell wall biosynthesis
MPRLHLVGIFHTRHSEQFSHCAFTGKALRFPKMLKMYGHRVTEYSNSGSDSEADEKVEILTNEEFNLLFGDYKNSEFFGNKALIGSEGHTLFEKKLVHEMRSRVSPGDIICHPFGHSHDPLLRLFPNNIHLETGIGYTTLMAGSLKIFESYAWMHYHQGMSNRHGMNYEWVVPNYYDLKDWDPVYRTGDYLAFLGRITELKGFDTIKAIAEHSPYKIVVCGQGNPEKWKHKNIDYLPPITGRARSEFLGNARALLAPSTFVEPFCGMSVEAMLCGTPVISVDYGAMTETVQDGMGFRCHTLKDWLESIEKVGSLDREYIAKVSRSKYSLEACGAKYSKIISQILDLNRNGWYELS